MAALLKYFSFKGFHHRFDATCLIVVISDEYSSAVLNGFKLSYVCIRVLVTYSCCIFQLGSSDKGLVTRVLEVLRTGRQVSAKKASGDVGILGHRVYMCITR